MTIEYIRYSINTVRQEEFVNSYFNAAKALAKAECCLGYELSQCEEEPTSFILRVEQTSTSDHLNSFRKSVEFKEFLPHIRPFINDIEEMQCYKKSKQFRETKKITKYVKMALEVPRKDYKARSPMPKDSHMLCNGT